jgi:hypothetical protein
MNITSTPVQAYAQDVALGPELDGTQTWAICCSGGGIRSASQCLVRPRPGRTELCGEFIENESLAAAAGFVAGTTRACAAAVRRPGARTVLPPRLDVRLARAMHRYGWYVDRRAFGTDLYAASQRAASAPSGPRWAEGRGGRHAQTHWFRHAHLPVEHPVGAQIYTRRCMLIRTFSIAVGDDKAFPAVLIGNQAG